MRSLALALLCVAALVPAARAAAGRAAVVAAVAGAFPTEGRTAAYSRGARKLDVDEADGARKLDVNVAASEGALIEATAALGFSPTDDGFEDAFDADRGEDKPLRKGAEFRDGFGADRRVNEATPVARLAQMPEGAPRPDGCSLTV